MALSFDPNLPYLRTLVGGPNEGDKVLVDVVTTAVTNESTNAVYSRDEAGQYVFTGYDN